MRTLFVLILAAVVAACAPRPSVRSLSSGEARNEDISLKSRIEQTAGRTLIVFVHGMGDHCPGYALHRRVGWFSAGVTTNLGLAPPKHSLESVDIPDFETRDPVSHLVMQRLQYTYPDGSHPVDAVEITWSGLTRWLKDKQLAFDLSDPTTKSGPADTLRPGQDIRDCVDVVGGGYDQPRVWVNKVLKDGLMDRSLSDVVIYVGSYGPKIEREIADALCRTFREDWSPVRKSPDGTPVRCLWPGDASVPYNDVVFITHSLGSRVVYDTMLELANVRMRPDSQVFSVETISAAKPTITQVLNNKLAIYMMANQLPMLGLSATKPSQSSADDPARLLQIAEFRESDAKTRAPGASSAFSLAGQSSLARSDPLFQLPFVRRADAEALDIVAFNDANDLLSYSLPDWYSGLAGVTNIDVTNVYVHNATRWFGIVENPAAAHTKYVNNPAVWKAIACGVVAESAQHCN